MDSKLPHIHDYLIDKVNKNLIKRTIQIVCSFKNIHINVLGDNILCKNLF